MANCADCFHPKENHELVDGGPNAICNGSLQCRCEHYQEPFLVEFAQFIEKEKARRRSIKARCKIILERIPQTRNCHDKTFPKIYKEVWHGFKIRKHGSTLFTTDKWNEMPADDDINREKRRVKEHNDNLKTYDPKVLRKQELVFQTMLELAAE